MAGKPPRRKGFGFERECVTALKAHGIEARRTVGSLYPDLWVNGRPVSCKRQKAMLKWAYDELDRPHDYILCRADGRKTLKISYWGLDT